MRFGTIHTIPEASNPEGDALICCAKNVQKCTHVQRINKQTWPILIMEMRRHLRNVSYTPGSSPF